jgi:LacI family repressor for deo operon, udp, cdd, tsx, nupC, and nupG
MLPPELLRGIIFYNNMCDDLSIWAEFQKYPLVQIGEHIKSGNCFAVLTNDREAMSELTRLLICKGHRRFVFLSNTYGENRYHFCIDREAGFRASLDEANIPVDENHFFYRAYTPEGGAEAARQIAAMAPRPDAVVCVSDTMAIGCLKELHRLQISIPGEIAVTGFDDMEYSEALYPSLTTVRQAYGEIGAEAMRTLDALATRQIRSGRVIYVQHTLIERESG